MASTRKMHYSRWKRARGPFCFDGYQRWKKPPAMTQDRSQVTCKLCLDKLEARDA